MITKYNEIYNLRQMLTDKGIAHTFIDDSVDGYYTHIQIEVNKPNSVERLISVIEGDGTYGGECDLLEIMGCLTEEERRCDCVVGGLTAEEVFKRITMALQLTEGAI